MFKRYGLILRMLPFLRPYRLRFALFVGLTILATLFGLLEPWPLAFLIDSVLEQDSPFPSWLSFAAEWSATAQIAFTIGLGFAFTVLSHGLTVAIRAVDVRLELGLILDVRSKIFEHVQRLSFQYHDRGVASHYIYLINDLAHHTGLLVTGLVPLGEAFLTLIGMFVIVWFLDPEVALAATAVVPLIYLATSMFATRMEDRLIAVRELEGGSIRIVHEKLSLIRVVVAFGREKYEHAKFLRQSREAVSARVNITIAQTVLGLVVALLAAIGTAVVLFISASAVSRGELSVGELTVILAYVRSVYRPIEQITHTFSSMQMQLIQIEMLFESLDTAPEVEDAPHAVDLQDPRGAIRFEDVAFDYREREGTLDGVSFSVAAGEFVAIVGATGAGKSTLVSLIPRYFDPHRGRVLIDGHDVKDLTIASVRGAVALVMQEPLLFSGTLADNIRYGALDATDDEVVEAAKRANCHDFIMSLPDGYETTVGERGTRISGGERQRVAVARAFLKDAPILILDEPTSSIDSRTEAVILDALEHVAEGRTTIMIAHRLSTMRNADRILVMDDGRLVEQGTHSELLALEGTYAALWRAQLDGREPPELTADLDDGPPPPVPLTGAIDLPTSADSSELTVPRPAELTRRPKVVVLGMMTKIPVAGVVWQTMHYLVGLERLGVEVYYVEAHARTPSMFMEREDDDGSGRAAAFIADAMHRFGFDGRWAFHALHDDGAVHGMTRTALDRLYAEADVIINLHGGTNPLPEHSATGRLVYVETDPVQLQIELYEQDAAAIAYLEPHVAFFTFGENYGHQDCLLPVSKRFRFLPTRQPVVRDFWEPFAHGPARSLTTIGNWRQPWREVQYKGQTYHWTKHLEFLKFMDLPERTGQRFELALSSYSDDDRSMLEARGWHIANALDFSIGLDSYRSYITASRGEFTVAKDQNVRMRTGWFSDRSATYLAAGRPVITQDTGFGNRLPTGSGLFAFSTVDEATAAVAAINGDYERHRRAAQAIAAEYFDHDVVLRPMLAELGVPTKRRTRPSSAGRSGALTASLDLTVVRRRPTTLTATTISSVLGAPVPDLAGTLPSTVPTVSIIVVTHGGLVFTRMCLESILLNTGRNDVEIIVVDNASTDMTPAYLEALSSTAPSVRVLANQRNVGFATAVNQGASKARGDLLVVLNNDVIVAPEWLDRLERHAARADVGMVGPLTNAAPNEAAVTVPYSSYGGYLTFAAERAAGHDGGAFDIDVLTMFCVAVRRDVFEQVGPLDERFEVGMFEDDDYALRVHEQGLRTVCAEDVVVHHFGEASFGALVPSGEHAHIFRSNRARFEDKWARSWTAHTRRPEPAYDDLVGRVRAAVSSAVPAGSTVLLVSKGDDDLLDVPGRTVRHFPSDADGNYAGWYPGSTTEVVEHLERQIEGGAGFVVFPEPATWWFEYYDGLEAHVSARCDELTNGADCRIFAVRQTTRVGEGAR